MILCPIRPRFVIFMVVVLVPVLAAAGFSYTVASATERMDDVVAAVVNHDEPAEVDGQTVPLGRQLAAALVEGEGTEETFGESQNFTWVMTNDELAEEGLEDGTYAAVVTIPEEFSEAATSTADPDGDIRQALLQVDVSPRARLADDVITRAIVQAATTSLGQELAATFLDNVFIGFNTMGEELGEAADGARSLADGVDELSEGAEELSGGAHELAGGLGELADGTGELYSGAHTLAGGAQELAGGAGELAGGVDELAGGVDQLAGGVDDLADGAGGLHEGVGDLAAGSSQLADGSNDLTQGARELSGGVDELSGGLAEFSGGMDELRGGANDLAGGLGELNDAVSVVPGYLDQIEDGLGQGAADVRDFADELYGSRGAIEDMIDQVCAQDPDGEACQALQDYLSDSEQLDEFLEYAAAGLHQLADSMDDAASGEGELGQIQELFDGLDQLATGSQELAAGLDEAHQASQELQGGAATLAGGAADLADGVSEYTQGVRDLDEGVDQLSQGTGELASGADALADASSQAAQGVGELSDGAHEIAGGSGDLASGAGQLADGIGEMAVGGHQLADGADGLAQGSEELSDGTGALGEGSEDLAEGLGEAVGEIPQYSDDVRETLADVVADPFNVEDEDGWNLPWLAFYSVLALWAGGLWLAFAYPVVPSQAQVSTRSAFSLGWRSLQTPLVIRAIQGLVD